MDKESSPTAVHLPHKVWRKQWKKMRRKKLRQISAKFRDAAAEQKELELMKSHSYRSWLLEQEHLGVMREAEEQEAALVRHQAWLEREKQAKLEWDQRKLKESQQKEAREKQEKQIQEEWEAIKKAEEAEKQKEEMEQRQKKEKQEALLRDALSELCQPSVQNPPVPSAEERTVESRPGLQLCPFFEKTGCCRFGPRCSRNHRHVLLSRCLLLEHFYQPLGVRYTLDDEQNLDVGLEFDDAERARHFNNFYDDVLPELRSHGEVVQFKVCQNYEPHLRGNVYVQYATENEAARAFKNLNGRWYGGEQISVRFVDVQRWSRAICGSFFRGNCPKGRNCNFLHVFKNPNGEFRRADRDLPTSAESTRQRSSSRRETNGWSTERRGSERSSERRGRDRSSERRSRRPSEDARRRSVSTSRRTPTERERNRRERSPDRRSSSRRYRASTDYDSPRNEHRSTERTRGSRSRRDDRYSREEGTGSDRRKSRRSHSPESNGHQDDSERHTTHRSHERSRSSKRRRSRSNDRERKKRSKRSPSSTHRRESGSQTRETNSTEAGGPNKADRDSDCRGEMAESDSTALRKSPEVALALSQDG
ncbi:U2 small nuclear ribonucleoprotein auxiliary factor 35 kDa subunit-related protein 2-like [Amphibalanus amphitrite]|uniref:U2 small nuclear ribonucleoprotein auxiliary factor 35 kDa subunit-related protein 2-like n=1 Tax=Amphibalanus amphitrite TaxID=1232801 RepID=UPI001C911E52|nr:U2 small nuclear ribonucleoprotein auxiliary factor 35 kDa subunit-related protein 2-like [Amphibalanus amphitrite]XP_043246092.1 U2 small nuclear ribonucleoprotein auxiliary factor 35 kDa subunit-related protein 2-like [Amphibalanus amphitrite]XP_043246093.1 U2 small nuclear ribonucleoprotein auxiliary factor 35 kDa subunit-related protein 2-like [Amphibalanus amphitrite]